MELSTPSMIFATVWSLFTWTSDLENYGVVDDVRSHAEAVKQGKPFRDDCDGFAVTTYDLLKEAGYDVKLIHVQSPLAIGDGNHLIVAYSENGKWFTIDNRYPGIRSMQKTITGSLYTVIGEFNR